MFKTSSKTINGVKENCNILITVPDKWENGNSWQASPANIYIVEKKYETNKRKTFTCYMSIYQNELLISTLKTVDKIIDPVLLEAYLLKFLEELIPYAGLLGAKGVVVESPLPMIVDAFLEKGFKVLKKNSFSNVYGGSYEIIGKN
jgi:hypothetical protein